MKKAVLIIGALILLLPLTACDKIKLADAEESTQVYEDRTAELESRSDQMESTEEPATVEELRAVA